MRGFFLRLFFSLLLVSFNPLNGYAAIDQSTGPEVPAKIQEKEKDKNYKEGELLVKFGPGISESKKQNIHKKHGSKKIKEFPSLRIEHIKLKKGMGVEEALALYSAEPDVEYAEPNFIVSILATPNDPRFGELWGLHNTGQSGGTPDADIDAPEAWDITTGSSNVVVAVIDTGVDYAHEDLAVNMWTNPLEIPANGIDDDGNGYIDDIYGIDTFNNDSDPFDDHGHGTHVSGTIGGVGDNGIGVAGVNWDVKIIACKFLSSGGSGDTADAVECLQYIKGLRDSGINIVATNNSWGGGGYSQTLYDAINAQREILFMAAAGNSAADNDSYSFYPANYYLPNLLSIAATDHNDARASFSDYGRRSVHVGAPGVDVLSSLPGNNYDSWSGTSMATPHASGLAALLNASDPTYDWINIKNLILSGGDNIASMSGKTITGKRLNAFGSLNCTDSPVFSILKCPATLEVGVPETLSVLSINCSEPVGPVSAFTFDGLQIDMRDDGIDPDMAAGDGIFTGTFVPVRTEEKISFSSEAGAEDFAISNLRITTSTLIDGIIGYPYNQFLSATGGKTPYAWSIASGSLPPGLALNGSTGEISGTPSFAGQFNFTVRLDEGYGTSATKGLRIIVYASGLKQIWSRVFDSGHTDSPRGVAADSATGNVYVTGSPKLTIAYSGFGNLLWSSMDGDGADPYIGYYDIKLDSEGNPLVTGYPYATIKYDTSGNILWTKTEEELSWAYAKGIAIDSSDNIYVTGFQATANRIATTFKYDPEGNVIWSRLYSKIELLAAMGVAVDSNGNVYVIAYTPPGYRPLLLKYDSSGNLLWETTQSPSYCTGYDVAVGASGNVYVTGEFPYSHNYLTLKYDGNGNLLWYRTYDSNTYDSGYGIAVDAYENVYVAGHSGGTSILVYDSDGNLINDSGSGGEAYDIALDANGYIYVAAEKHNGSNYDFNTIKYAPLFMIMPAALPSGTKDVSYSQSLQTLNGAPPYTWRLATGSLPTGLALNEIEGAIEGTPSATGTFNFAIQAVDSGYKPALKYYSITVYGPPTVTTSSLPDGTVNLAYNQTLSATGGLPPYSWLVISGGMPDGLTLDSSTGVISGIPTATGTYNFTARVTDANASMSDKALSITVYEPLSITTSFLPSGTIGVPYGESLSATGGLPPYSWSIVSGSLPPGLALNSSTGEISGTPTAAGTYNFTAQVSDLNANTVVKALSIIIYAPLAVTTSSLGPGNICNPYTQTLAAEGGLPPYVWSLVSGSLPGGVSLNSSTGEISGTPAAMGAFSLSVQVTDAQSATAGMPLAVDVYCPARISGAPFNYLLLQESYNSTSDGGTLDIPAMSTTEDLNFDLPKSVTLKGGYDCDFTDNPSYTTINGNMTNSAGSITLEKIILKGTLTINGGTVIPNNMILE